LESTSTVAVHDLERPKREEMKLNRRYVDVLNPFAGVIEFVQVKLRLNYRWLGG